MRKINVAKAKRKLAALKSLAKGSVIPEATTLARKLLPPKPVQALVGCKQRLKLGDVVCDPTSRRHQGSIVHLGGPLRNRDNQGIWVIVQWHKTGHRSEFRHDALELVEASKILEEPWVPKSRPKTIRESPRASLERTLHTVINAKPDTSETEAKRLLALLKEQFSQLSTPQKEAIIAQIEQLAKTKRRAK